MRFAESWGRLVRKAILGLVAVLVLGVVASVAWATPEVTGVQLAKGTAGESASAKAHRHGDVIVRKITIAPGGSTGWHAHDGELVAVVESGTLTRIFGDCTSHVSRAGEAFVEKAGQRHVGLNLGTEPVVLYATYLLPSGSALSKKRKDPGC